MEIEPSSYHSPLSDGHRNGSRQCGSTRSLTGGGAVAADVLSVDGDRGGSLWKGFTRRSLHSISQRDPVLCNRLLVVVQINLRFGDRVGSGRELDFGPRRFYCGSWPVGGTSTDDDGDLFNPRIDISGICGRLKCLSHPLRQQPAVVQVWEEEGGL